MLQKKRSMPVLLYFFDGHVVEPAGAFAAGDAQVEAVIDITAVKLRLYPVQVDDEAVFLNFHGQFVGYSGLHRLLQPQKIPDGDAAVSFHPQIPHVDAAPPKDDFQVIAVVQPPILLNQLFGQHHQRRASSLKGAVGGQFYLRR